MNRQRTASTRGSATTSAPWWASSRLAPLGRAARTLWRLYRVRDWLHFLPLPVAGFMASRSHDVATLAGGVVGWGFALAFACAVNNAFDDKLDRRSPLKNPVGRSLGRNAALAWSVPPLLASIVVVSLLAPDGLPACVMMLLASTLYSSPPRLKRVPGLGTVWNLVIGVPGLFFATYGDVTALPMRLVVGLFALLLLVSQLLHEIADRDDDREEGISTLATVLGLHKTFLLASLAVLTLPLLAWLLAEGSDARAAVTLACAIFAAAWAVLLSFRPWRAELLVLRSIRLYYRHTAMALGAVVYLVSV